MKVYHDIHEFKPINNAVVTIGTFDGVHLGHRKIISRLQELAKQTGGETVILTFFPHPRMILKPEDQNLKLITTIQEKAQLLDELGIDHLIITPFSRDFSNLSAEEYIREMLINRIGTKKIVIGYDHRFGKDRTGGLTELQKFATVYDYEVEEIPEQDVNEVTVSSSRIRKALLQTEISLANKFLGYAFFITGKVIRGDQIGRTLGYPTANLFVEESYKLIPADGIFAVTVEVKTVSGEQRTENDVNAHSISTPHTSLLYGMAYIGHRPTINGMARNIEVNIFDFDQDIYNQTLQMSFHAFIRHDVKFSGLEELTQQLGRDKESVLSYFSNNPD